jgi:LL-diaminopimelate aminotransferase
MDYRTNRLKPNFFAVLNTTVAKLKVAGEDIIRLDIGSPDMPPAPHIIEALAESARGPDSHGYQPHRGTASLREAWAGMYSRLHGVDLDPDGIVPLLGSKEGVFHLSQAVLTPDDIVLVPDPGYLTYAQSAHFAGAETVLVRLKPENNYLPDLSKIPVEVVQRAKILWLNYPNNPTAAVAPLNFLAEAVAFCRKNDILLCHDAAYTQITYDGYRAPSVLEVPGAGDVAVEFNTLSKSHNMAGWRVGAAFGHPGALEAMLKLKTHADSGHFLGITQAAIAALTGDQTWVEDRNLLYQERRDIVENALKAMGLEAGHSQASLYVWFATPSGRESDSFVLDLLEHAHLSLAPGSIFGPGGMRHVRISLTQPIDRIKEAMARLGNWLETAN